MGHKDLLEVTVLLRDALADLERAPLRTPRNPGLHEAWRKLVAPRAARGRSVIDALLRPTCWSFDDEDRARSATSTAWALARRELARIYAGLSVALAGLLNAAPSITTRGLALRLRRAADFGPDDRVKRLRSEQREAFERLREGREEPERRSLHRLAKDLRGLQKQVRRSMAGVQALLGALARAEQDRLVDAAGRDPDEPLAEALAALRRARLDLDEFPGRPTSALALRFDAWWAAREGVQEALAGRGSAERSARRRTRADDDLPATSSSETAPEPPDTAPAEASAAATLEILPAAGVPDTPTTP